MHKFGRCCVEKLEPKVFLPQDLCFLAGGGRVSPQLITKLLQEYTEHYKLMYNSVGVSTVGLELEGFW